MNSVACFPSPTVQEPPDDSFNVQRSQGKEEGIARNLTHNPSSNSGFILMTIKGLCEGSEG